MKISMHDKIVNDVISQINTGSLKPGEKLPTNRELATKYKTSEVTVRKSISTLARMGYVESIERIGSYVKKRDKDNFSINISPEININEDITDETIETVYLTLITMLNKEKYFQAIETRKILYSGPIPVCYMINSLLINKKYSSKFYVRLIENKQDTISLIINNPDIKKIFEITMDPPDIFVCNKLLLKEDDPILCFNIYYYTKDDCPVAKSVYYVAGNNIELKGTAQYKFK